MLSQEQEGQEKVIAYASSKLGTSQARYGSTKGELFAGTWAMEKFAFFLKFGPQFKWRTDNIALKYWKTLQAPPSAIARWLEKLADFNFEVEHRAGFDHQNADTLSRYPTTDPETTTEQTLAFMEAVEARPPDARASTPGTPWRWDSSGIWAAPRTSGRCETWSTQTCRSRTPT